MRDSEDSPMRACAQATTDSPANFARLLQAIGLRRKHYASMLAASQVVDVPLFDPSSAESAAAYAQYSSLVAEAPLHAQSVAFLLHCMLTQVCSSAAGSSTADIAAGSLRSIEALLDAEMSAATRLPPSAATLASSALNAAEALPTLLPLADVALERASVASPLLAPRGGAEVALVAERALMSALPRAGKARVGMPAAPLLTDEERGVERTELHHFSQLLPAQVDAAMQVRGFAAAVDAADAHRGSAERHGTDGLTGWVFTDRAWADELDESGLSQTMLAIEAASVRPRRLDAYHARDDTLLVAYHTAVPPEREQPHARLLPLADKVFRPFGEWHDRAMRARPADDALASAAAPDDAAILYRFGSPKAARALDKLATSASFYPADGTVLHASAGPGGDVQLYFPDGTFGRLERRRDAADSSHTVAAPVIDGAAAAAAECPAADSTKVPAADANADAEAVNNKDATAAAAVDADADTDVDASSPTAADDATLSLTIGDARAHFQLDIPPGATRDAPIANLSYATRDGMQLRVDCTGAVELMLEPEPYVDDPAPPMLVLKLSHLRVSNVPPGADEASTGSATGSDPYLLVRLVDDEDAGGGGDEGHDDVSARTIATSNVTEAVWEDELLLPLPRPLSASAKLPRVRIQLMKSDETNKDDPVASADYRLESRAGVLESYALTPCRDAAVTAAAATAAPLISLSFALQLADPAEATAASAAAAADALKPPPREVLRRVLPSGTVLVTFADGTLRALLRDGNVSERAASGPHEGSWIVTNSAGLRAGYQPDGKGFYVPSLSVASSTDPLSGHVVTTRADGTVLLQRTDGSRSVAFADGTVIESTVDVVKGTGRGEVRVLTPQRPMVRIDLRRRRISSSADDGALIGFEDGCITLTHRNGLRASVSREGRLQLFAAGSECLGGGEASSSDELAYNLNLALGELRVTDFAGNTFALGLDGERFVDLAVQDTIAKGLVGGKSSSISAATDEATAIEEAAAWSHPPRLFVCRPDGTGIELLRPLDMALFERRRGADATVVEAQIDPTVHSRSLVHLWRDEHAAHDHLKYQCEATAELQAHLGSTSGAVAAAAASAAPLLRFRRLVHMPQLTLAERVTFEAELHELEQWKEGEEERARELHVRDARGADQLATESELRRELLREMALPTNQSADISAVLQDERRKAAEGYQRGVVTGNEERRLAAEAEAERARADEEARLEALEAAKFRKPDDAESRNGGYERRRITLGLGSTARYHASETAAAIGPAAAAAEPAAAAPSATVRADGPAPTPAPLAASGEDATPPPHPPAASATGVAVPVVTNAVAAATSSITNGWSAPKPRRGQRPVAESTPNVHNLVTEVPFKRGVRTLSSHPKVLSAKSAPAAPEPAFTLMPPFANFGTLRAGCIYRLSFSLLNVSLLPQRFKHVRETGAASTAVRAVYQPGVVMPGMRRTFEVEIGSDEPLALDEPLLIATEREVIRLPVTASILDAQAYDEYLGSSQPKSARAGEPVPRLLSMSMRDPALLRTVALRAGDVDGGFKKGLAPPRGGVIGDNVERLSP